MITKFNIYESKKDIGSLKLSHSNAWPIFIELEDRYIVEFYGWDENNKLNMKEYKTIYKDFYEYLSNMYNGIGKASHWINYKEFFKEFEDVFDKKIKNIYFNDDPRYGGINLSQLEELLKMVIVEMVGKKYNL